MKNTLIIQLKMIDRGTDYDRLIDLEDALIQGYEQSHSGNVDGHDIGDSNMNIFIHPKKTWGPCIEVAIAYLKHKNMQDQAVVIKRSKSGKYQVAWPLNFAGEYERV
jgi:hypothetical protein